MAEGTRFRKAKVHGISSCSGTNNFGKLCDEIIMTCILPHLSLKEQGRTSILSRRWRNLWRCSPAAKLVFPHGLRNESKYSSVDDPMLKNYRARYIKWVDSVLKSFMGPTLSEFCICYDLDANFSHVVDGWLGFALQKGVEKLDLNLGPFIFLSRLTKINYVFPAMEKLSSFPGLDIGLSCNGGSAISNLKELSLNHVNIQGETLEYLLTNCPVLESISLQRASSLNLKIVGPLLRLKYLEICHCSPVEKVEVAAPNLISLKYDGPKDALILRDVPLLVHLYMYWRYFRHFLNETLRHPLSHFVYVCNLKKLELEMPLAEVEESISFPLELPDFIKLEELKLTMTVRDHLFLLWPGVLLRAAPLLQRFVVKIHYLLDIRKGGIYEGLFKDRMEKMRRAGKCTHQCLKVLEVAGVMGVSNDVELVRHLVGIARSLEKLVLGINDLRKLHPGAYDPTNWRILAGILASDVKLELR